jgi:hypothetical protein
MRALAPILDPPQHQPPRDSILPRLCSERGEVDLGHLGAASRFQMLTPAS